jgi:acetylornithine/succinyldiaminopimelate/putrescine aminotransferase
MNIIEKLNTLRQHGGKARTTGLDDAIVRRFAKTDPSLEAAVDEALARFEEYRATEPDLLALDEVEQVRQVQASYINFYPNDAVCPYVSLAANGPWIITLKGAVIYECGGYGMIGFGHSPDAVLEAMARPQVMANIMTPNISQLRLARALDREIGHHRGDNPFTRYFCLNSGSEAVTLAARIVDVNAKLRTDPGGSNAGQPIRKIGLAGAFHGRTDRPARFSDSTRKTYAKYLASFRDRDSLVAVAPNKLEQLQQAFDFARGKGVFIEAFFLEPVMGEGNPGLSITREFYDLARKLTREHGSLLLVDSIQAGLRAQGVLSIVDYPGFEGIDPPDMETYSKALNAGQYPLSVLAITEETADIYQKGVYGNTMTSNPRALDVAVSVLDSLDDSLRENVRARGAEMVRKLEALGRELGGRITSVQGTGLLISAELDERYKCYGADSTEEYIRLRGVNVIHGGKNSLRYTPHFMISSAEIDLMIDVTRQALLHGPVKEKIEASVAA